MTLTKRGAYVAGFMTAAILAALLAWGQATADYCQNERHAKTFRCAIAQP